MASVTLSIGGYQYQLACRDGEEAHLARLGAIVDAKVNEARAAVGTASEVRQLLLSSLLFADQLIESQSAGAPRPQPSPVAPDAISAIAARAEAIAAALEKLAPTP